jgi:NADPH-dependent 2,4-dienoyl-CoA reductase/sulfur reductase-like enzyme/peroxiredoxin family protein/rhodanese-related sulfurtransferase/TusA-related sulfurtransferase
MALKKRVLIVGGVAGGASTAARLRRLDENVEIVMFERGEYISFANCGLPYHIGNVITERDRLLVQTPEKMHERFGIDVRTLTEVIAIDQQAKTVQVRDLRTGEDATEPYDTLVLTPGAEPICPPIPGVDSANVFTLRNIPDMDAIKKNVDDGSVKSPVGVGGGYIGLEMAEALVERGVKVSLVELAPQVMGTVDPEMAAPLHQELQLHGVDLRLNNSVTKIVESEGGLTVYLSDGHPLTVQMVIMAIGVRPEVKLAKEAGLAIGQRGGIAVNERMQTSDESIYAAGDAVEVMDFVGGFEALIPLAGPANRQGRIIADNICGRDSAYHSTQGTAICKVFNLAVATTGMNEKGLKRAGLDYEKIYVHPANHAGYYPGAAQMSLKLLFDPKTAKILGAQAVGTKGIDKRIDILAVAMRAGLTVYDLQEMELCYAPPFGSAKDPVNYAGFVAANILNGDAAICHVEDVLKPSDNQKLLDVRMPAEVEAGTIPGAMNIPLDDLRGRLDELSKDKELLVFCQAGVRGYLACRILTQNGFTCRNLTGGYRTYCAAGGVCDEKESFQKEMTNDTGQVETRPEPKSLEIVQEVNACGLQCPGPVLRLKEAVDAIEVGQAVRISTTDAGFAADVKGWCESTGNQLQELTASGGKYSAMIVKGSDVGALVHGGDAKKKTIVVFSGDFDKAMAAFIIANGAVAMGSEVTLFFTFWGLNLLRRPESIPVQKNMVEKMFGFMMPRGAGRTKLSKMNMGGMGTWMMQGIMKKKNVASLSELIDTAQKGGVRLVACAMSMDLMGIKKEELIDGIEEGGVASYLNHAEAAGVTLFI